MGVNNTGQQPMPQPTLTPQQQQLRGLQTMAVTPYAGGARGGGAAQGAAQLAAALMARQKQQALVRGNPGATQQPLPVAQAPIAPPSAGPGVPAAAPGAAPLMAPGNPGAPQAFGAANPQAQPMPPMMQNTPGLLPGMMGPP